MHTPIAYETNLLMCELDDYRGQLEWDGISPSITTLCGATITVNTDEWDGRSPPCQVPVSPSPTPSLTPSPSPSASPTATPTTSPSVSPSPSPGSLSLSTDPQLGTYLLVISGKETAVQPLKIIAYHPRMNNPTLTCVPALGINVSERVQAGSNTTRYNVTVMSLPLFHSGGNNLTFFDPRPIVVNCTATASINNVKLASSITFAVAFTDLEALAKRSSGDVFPWKEGALVSTNGDENIEVALPQWSQPWLEAAQQHPQGPPYFNTTLTLTYTKDSKGDSMVLPFNITSGSGQVPQLSFYAPPYEDVCSGARQGLDCELSLSVAFTAQYTKEREKEMLTAGCPGDSWHCVRGLWSGVYYHYACLGYDDSQMCKEGRGNCAYGGGSRCSPCPEGAVCPGKVHPAPMPE